MAMGESLAEGVHEMRALPRPHKRSSEFPPSDAMGLIAHLRRCPVRVRGPLRRRLVQARGDATSGESEEDYRQRRCVQIEWELGTLLGIGELRTFATEGSIRQLALPPLGLFLCTECNLYPAMPPLSNNCGASTH